MQSTARPRRFGPEQIKHASVALAIVGGIVAATMAATVIDDSGSRDSKRAATMAGAVAERRPIDFRFMEQNLELPAARPAATVDGVLSYQFMEQNLYLPAGDPATAPDWRVIEQNSWGEDFVFDSPGSGSLYPSVDDVPQLEAGQVRY